jgi:hypothetical protein
MPNRGSSSASSWHPMARNPSMTSVENLGAADVKSCSFTRSCAGTEETPVNGAGNPQGDWPQNQERHTCSAQVGLYERAKQADDDRFHGCADARCLKHGHELGVRGRIAHVRFNVRLEWRPKAVHSKELLDYFSTFARRYSSMGLSSGNAL